MRIASQGDLNDTVYILKSGVVSVSTKLVYRDYMRHPLDRDEWQVTSKTKTINV